MSRSGVMRWKVGLVLLAVSAAAQAASPVGMWKTIDDETGKPKSIVRIWVAKGKLYGKITKLINPTEPNPKCDKCPSWAKDKPVVGLLIIWDLKKEEGEEWWDGGSIMDPKNGKIYRCKMRLTDGGKKLEVRGYIGFSLLGRSQTWHKM